MKKRKDQNCEKNDTTVWMVTFSDLIMLLLTFFVMLLTMKSMDTKILKNYFGILTGGVNVLEFSELSAIKPVEDVEDIAGISTQNHALIDTLHEHLNALMASSIQYEVSDLNIFKNIVKYKNESNIDYNIKKLVGLTETFEDERGVIIDLESRILFEEKTAEFKPEVYELLDAIAQIINVTKNEVLIMGHADKTPLYSEAYRSNWELSLYRALKVQKYFTSKNDLLNKRIFAGGYGDTRPKYSNETKEGKEKNGRVEIILKRKIK